MARGLVGSVVLVVLLALTPAAPAVAQSSPGSGAANPRVISTDVTSFDGTHIATKLAIPTNVSGDVPLVLIGHGWGATKETVENGLYPRLLDAGYAVLTWDARGFGQSGGQAHVDQPDIEGRDVSALLDFAAAQDGILLDGPGDPRVGMAGQSYGGGIQPNTAAFDDRVDVLEPEITWNSLVQSLYPNEVIKQGWIALLVGLGAGSGTLAGLAPDQQGQVETGALAPEIYQALIDGLVTNRISDANLELFRDASLAVYGDQHPVTRPTMLIQGFNDTLFPFDQALANADAIAATGAPVKLVGLCGGLDAASGSSDKTIVHGICPPWYTVSGNASRVIDLQVRWFDRWLKGTPVDTGPAVEWTSNEGVWHTAGDREVLAGRGTHTVTAEVTGTVPGSSAPTGGAVIFATPSAPGSALQVPIATAGDQPLEVVGTPHLSADVTVTGAGETFLFAKLVDLDAGTFVAESPAGHAIQMQETPVRVDVPATGGTTHVDLDLVPTSYTLPAGHRLVFQLATSSLQYSQSRGASDVQVDGTVAVPTRPLVVDRLAGPDRTATAYEVSRDRAHATTVVVARDDDYADALAGAPLAAQLDAPILLTAPDALDDDVRREVLRLGATDAVVLGGEHAVSPAVAGELTALGVTVRRVAGSNRFATAAAVAGELTDPAGVLVVEGADADPSRGWPDAVSASGFAATANRAVLLTSSNTLPEATRTALGDLGSDDVRVVGGSVAVSDAVLGQVADAAGTQVSRLAGTDRLGTSVAVARAAIDAGADPSQLWLATDANWPDALTAGAAVAQRGGVLLLSPAAGPTTPSATAALVRELGPQLRRVVLVGGPAAIAASAADQVLALRR